MLPKYSFTKNSDSLFTSVISLLTLIVNIPESLLPSETGRWITQLAKNCALLIMEKGQLLHRHVHEKRIPIPWWAACILVMFLYNIIFSFVVYKPWVRIVWGECCGWAECDRSWWTTLSEATWRWRWRRSIPCMSTVGTRRSSHLCPPSRAARDFLPGSWGAGAYP